ncbi:sensor histidine kinase [Sphingomonas solaris]|uniref:histidine kinase n=1 Tax=Alterirhizorhabdus solaris TaxID=2529389 RepID=A0A558RAR0_9SPHN|nr:HWE histidine kinase domain-containing protein [Sphingomonas solaris]TVV76463.1 PAS domain S-box protein [Sphingomonas solaris]
MIIASDLDSAGLGAVLKTALDAVVVMRTDGTIAGWNDVAERTFGWSFGDALGRRMSDMIIPVRYRDAHEHGLAHYLATGEGPVLDRHLEIEALHRDGHELPIELSITRTEQFGEPVFLGFLRDITERHAAERRQALLVGELNHRVKNLLGVVSGIAHQTIKASRSLEEFGPAFTGRLQSLGRAHEILTDGAWERASLAALVNALLGPYLDAGDKRMSVSGPQLMLSPRHFLSLSMILHELITNSVKYGALSTEGCRVTVIWGTDGSGDTWLSWIESGLSNVEAPHREGFGSRMIALSVKHELRGHSTREWLSGGMAFRLTFPSEAIG